MGSMALPLIPGLEEVMGKMPTPPKGACLIRCPPVLPPELEEISTLLARMEEPVNWFGMEADELRRLSWIALTSFSIDEDSRVAEIVGPIYMEYRDSVPVNERAAFIDEISQAVASGAATVGALMTLCVLEDPPALIAMAAAKYADARGMAEHDPVPAADLLLATWEEDYAEHRAGKFLGLLLLGDPEVFDRLRALRFELTDDEVGMICDATIVSPYNTTVEFMLEWLEETQADHDHGKFTMLASAMTPTSSEDEEEDEPQKADGRRLIIPGDGDGIPDHWYFPIEPRSIGRHLGPRLMALARHETGPRVMPAVLEAYGLEPEGEVS
jgi:hypothetical protein